MNELQPVASTLPRAEPCGESLEPAAAPAQPAARIPLAPLGTGVPFGCPIPVGLPVPGALGVALRPQRAVASTSQRSPIDLRGDAQGQTWNVKTAEIYERERIKGNGGEALLVPVTVAGEEFAANPNRTPCVLLHGLTGNHAGLNPLARRLRDEGYDVYVWLYDDRKTAVHKTAAQLTRELGHLRAMYNDDARLVLIGRSMGTVLGRCALNSAQDPTWRKRRAANEANPLFGFAGVDFLSVTGTIDGASTVGTGNPLGAVVLTGLARALGWNAALALRENDRTFRRLYGTSTQERFVNLQSSDAIRDTPEQPIPAIAEDLLNGLIRDIGILEGERDRAEIGAIAEFLWGAGRFSGPSELAAFAEEVVSGKHVPQGKELRRARNFCHGLLLDDRFAELAQATHAALGQLEFDWRHPTTAEQLQLVAETVKRTYAAVCPPLRGNHFSAGATPEATDRVVDILRGWKSDS